MVLVYASPVTPRVQYAVKLLLGRLCGLETAVTGDRQQFLEYGGPKICYSGENLGGAVWILPQGLLSQTGVTHQYPVTGLVESMPVIFSSRPVDGALPFDPLAASFYMVTRYEEYQNANLDRHGRFIPAESIAWQGNFIQQPVVNQWARYLAGRLSDAWPGIKLNFPSYRFESTIDVDHAFAFRGRRLLRTLGGTARDLSKFDFRSCLSRCLVLGGYSKDPFDTFDYLFGIHKIYELVPRFFILLADYGGDDNNVSTDFPAFREMIRRISEKAPTGIHPSITSSRSGEVLRREMAGLSEITGLPVETSRQHFLKLSLPATYRELVSLGIREDYTMGYAQVPGFRAGIASSFAFFDLYRNEETALEVHPFAVMDVTFRDYLRMSPAESAQKIKQIAGTVRSVNGEFITLWHNESVSEFGRWKGWRHVFEEVLAFSSGKE